MTDSPGMLELLLEHWHLARSLRRLAIVFEPEKCVGLFECYEVCPVDCWRFTPGDGSDTLAWMANRILGLRIFPDADGLMNRDVAEAGGELLVVSQFTLYGDGARGRRPSFVAAAPPEQAAPLYRQFVDACRRGTVPVAEGRFGAMMRVSLVNDGPVTLVIER